MEKPNLDLAKLELEVPGSLAERWDVAILATQTGMAHRAQAAALGICWPRFRRQHPYRGDALTYSSTVIDRLLGAGADFGALAEPGAEAVRLCLAGLVPVEGAELFSDPPSAGRTDEGASSTASS